MEALTALALLACPVGMGLMMWFMARGGRHRHADPRAMSVTELEAEHQRLGSELARAERREEVRS